MFKFISTIAVVGLISVSGSWAQVKPPVVSGTAKDTSMLRINPALAATADQSGNHEKDRWRDFECPTCGRMMMPRTAEEWRNWHMPMTGEMMMHPMNHRFLPALFMLCCLSLMALVNIILTILVSLDMARRRQFNGLWIPVLLLMGIPGTALYALFRIGDIISSVSQKTAS
jgi:hypothetical protein